MVEVKPIVYRNGKEYRPEQEIISIENMAEYIREYYPDIFDFREDGKHPTTEEICAIDRGNIEIAVDVMEKYSLIENIAHHISKDLMENHEIYVVDAEISRIDDDMIIYLYCLP